MKEHAAQAVSDEAFAARHSRWSFDVPDTKEAYLIRDIFDGNFLFSLKQSRPDLACHRIVPYRSCREDGRSVRGLYLFHML